IVQVEKIKAGETEEGGHGCFPVAVPFDELEIRVLDSNAQVHRADNRAVNQCCFTNKQQDSPPIYAQDSQLRTATSCSRRFSGRPFPLSFPFPLEISLSCFE